MGGISFYAIMPVLFLVLGTVKALDLFLHRRKAEREFGPVRQRVRFTSLSRSMLVYDLAIGASFLFVAALSALVGSWNHAATAIMASLAYLTSYWLGVSARDRGLETSSGLIQYSGVESYDWKNGRLRVRLRNEGLKQRVEWTVPARSRDLVQHALAENAARTTR